MSDSVLTYLDSYCERAGQAGLLAEPLNALTNLFFIAVAVAVARALAALPAAPLRARTDIWLLALFLFAIGIGSGAWHMLPNQATLLMDVVPITLFINLYIISALRRLLMWRWVWVLLGWLAYAALGVVAQKNLPPDMLNGTIMYIPTYGALLLLAALVARKSRADGRAFALAALVWTLALTCRTVDMELCERLAIGTHFLWHTLNAWVLWRLMQVLMKKAQ